MPRYALIKNNAFTELRYYDIQPSDIPHKSIKWLPCDPVVQPIFDPSTEIITGPTYNIQPTQVIEQWGKRNLTTQEIDSAKQGAVDGLNGSIYKVVLKAFLIVTNDIRDLRLKVNAIIDATGISGTVPKYTITQASQVTIDQLKTFIKNNL